MAKAITLTSTVSAPYTCQDRRSIVKQVALRRLARKLFGKKRSAGNAPNSHEVYIGL
jgi:hypothetical protein